MIRADVGEIAELERARQLEWLETNGLGGFACSTVIGMNTRRYHGLLTAATKPPVGRLLLLSKFEETLLIEGRSYDLSTNQYPGAIYPEGHRYLTAFRLDPFPVFTYSVAGIEIEKRVCMVHGENTTVVEYDVQTADIPPDSILELRPLIAFRDYHATTHHNQALDRTIEIGDGMASVAPYPGLPRLYFGHNARDLAETGDWYFNFEYAVEQERGLDANEDLLNPFALRFALRAGMPAVVVASTQPHSATGTQALRKQEVARRKAIAQSAPGSGPFFERLAAAADQFIVRRGNLHSIIAGYPWFADWGRDTMIALPGLTLATGRPEIARSILEVFAANADRGMLPNRFPDEGEEPEYNTVDATLWMFEAVRAYLHYTGDGAFVKTRLYEKLKDIINWHLSGTRYGIRVDPDGLLHCGEPGVQLTWMDAKIGDWVVTPRTGKPVEIQALWYNALCVLADLAQQFSDPGPERALRELARECRDSFPSHFWNVNAGCLFDVVNGEFCDCSVRPNQIFAVSLHHRMLTPEQEAQIVGVAERDLLTPLGLRSLSPRDPAYRTRYEGGVYARDSAYHQGTVWPWLMGPFLTAYANVHGRNPKSKKQMLSWLRGFEEHLRNSSLGQISEIADADAPFTPRGCFAQAWSVAEILRTLVEDVHQVRAGSSPKRRDSFQSAFVRTTKATA